MSSEAFKTAFDMMPDSVEYLQTERWSLCEFIETCRICAESIVSDYNEDPRTKKPSHFCGYYNPRGIQGYLFTGSLWLCSSCEKSFIRKKSEFEAQFFQKNAYDLCEAIGLENDQYREAQSMDSEWDFLQPSPSEDTKTSWLATFRQIYESSQ